MKSTPILKYSGLTIFTIGLALNIWMFISEAWPTYLFLIMMGVGGLLFGLSFLLKRLNTFWQIGITLIPFIIFYILVEITEPSHDVFLIPQGFRGKVVIEYGQADGQPKEFDGRWRIYRIPQNGILKTQFTLKGEVIDLSGSKYFFIDSKGGRSPLKAFCGYCDKKDTSSVQIMYGSLGTDSLGTFQDFWVDVPTKNINQVTK